MDFSVEFFLVIFTTFLSSYYLGWWVRGRWEAKKHLFVKAKKDLKKAKKK